ncbi:hypothetical protein PVAND_014697 [Polypedilum vanderplanki]|uniref:Hemolymph juvenile hormone binding protein n=1 Tax=Polypedilum vanderplanki TaxID=319348 RepID=A0A9J6BAF5_POLVA|nr:hypothetical protein PVAND_014697 [Polypedilum vanderplanki]
MTGKILFFTILFVVCGVLQSKISSKIKVCKRSDPQLSECIINSINDLRPSLATGDLGDGINAPPLEPFSIENLDVGQNSDFQITMKNLSIRGPSTFKIDKFRANINDLKFDLIITLPKLNIKGQYILNLRLFNTPLRSNGDILLKLEDYRAKINMKGIKYLRGTNEHMKFERFNLKIHQGKVKLFKLTNLFNGQKNLEEAANSIFLENSEFVLSNVYPSLEARLGELFTDIANNITADATFDELFPN